MLFRSTVRPEAELREGEFDELATEGVLEDEVMEGLLDVERGEDEIEEELEEQTRESEEEDEEAEEEALSLEVLAEEELSEASLDSTEASEMDLSLMLRRQLGLESGPSEREEEEEEVVVRAEPRRPDEFLCTTCFQRKRRTLLADPARSRCVDCVNNDADARQPR